MKIIQDVKEYLQEKFQEQKPISLKQAVGVVAGVHVMAGVGIFYASMPKTYAKDKEFLNTPEAIYAGIPDVIPTPTPTPTPKPTPEPLKKEVMPDGRVATYPKPQEIPQEPLQVKPQEKPQEKPKINSKYTQSYTIKKGDTIHSISKRFKLNTKKLLEINHIKNPNNIREGQVLKFI
jgi:LysM repeat protein